jgi:hypothetical protein
MKANELRIGNWGTITKGGKSKPIKFTSFFGLANTELRPEQFTPIPLTPEILEKAGIEKITMDWEHHFAGFDETGIQGVVIEKMKTVIVFKSGMRLHSMQPISYLHQLQNLYYVNTGEELQIEL